MAYWLPAGYRSETETEVKRSRFVTTLARVDEEAAARAVVAEVRRAHPAARHHCSALILGMPDAQPVERSSDDGEPAGTAGMPMLDVLRREGLCQAVAVVTRYFGGVLLGTGGLARAYSDAVATALAQAPRVRPVLQSRWALSLGHADAGRVQGDLLASGVTVVEAAYGERVELVLAAPPEVDLAALVARATRGHGRLTAAGASIVEEELGRSSG